MDCGGLIMGVKKISMVYSYCFRRTGSWSLAEDAVQATFAALWRRAVAGKVEDLRLDSARPLLLAMARDECLLGWLLWPSRAHLQRRLRAL
jgi:hypothetical protein